MLRWLKKSTARETHVRWPDQGNRGVEEAHCGPQAIHSDPRPRATIRPTSDSLNPRDIESEMCAMNTSLDPHQCSFSILPQLPLLRALRYVFARLERPSFTTSMRSLPDILNMRLKTYSPKNEDIAGKAPFGYLRSTSSRRPILGTFKGCPFWDSYIRYQSLT